MARSIFLFGCFVPFVHNAEVHPSNPFNLTYSPLASSLSSMNCFITGADAGLVQATFTAFLVLPPPFP